MDLPPPRPSRWNPVAFVLWRRRAEPGFSMQFAGLLLLGLGFCAVGISGTWRQYQRGRTWREVSGRSTQLDFVQETVSGNRPGTRLTRWRVQLAYRYEVDGKEWTGSRIHESPEADVAWDDGDREGFERRYAAGRPLRVYVDPQDASEALLEASVDYHDGVRWLLLGLVFAVPGALLTLGPTRGEHARDRPTAGPT